MVAGWELTGGSSRSRDIAITTKGSYAVHTRHFPLKRLYHKTVSDGVRPRPHAGRCNSSPCFHTGHEQTLSMQAEPKV